MVRVRVRESASICISGHVVMTLRDRSIVTMER